MEDWDWTKYIRFLGGCLMCHIDPSFWIKKTSWYGCIFRFFFFSCRDFFPQVIVAFSMWRRFVGLFACCNQTCEQCRQNYCKMRQSRILDGHCSGVLFSSVFVLLLLLLTSIAVISSMLVLERFCLICFRFAIEDM